MVHQYFHKTFFNESRSVEAWTLQKLKDELNVMKTMQFLYAKEGHRKEC